MTTLLLGVVNASTGAISMNNPTVRAGTVLMPVEPATIPGVGGQPGSGPRIGAGLFTESPGGTADEIELTYNATIAPNVTLFIDIWIRGTTFEKLFVTSTDPANYPIEGKYELQADGAWTCTLVVG